VSDATRGVAESNQRRPSIEGISTMGVFRASRGGKTVSFPVGASPVTVGSARDCTIVVAGAPKQAQVYKSAQGMVVRDLAGSTAVNGKRVKEQVLREGDAVQIGGETFHYSEKSNGATAALPVAAPAGAQSRGQTSRIQKAAAPAPKGETRRIEKPSTQRVETKPSTQRVETRPATQRVDTRPATQRIAAGKPETQRVVKKTTSRSQLGKKPIRASAPRLSGKLRVVAITAVVALLAVGGVFWAVISSRVNPEEVKKRANEELVKALEIQDPLERFKKLEGILASDIPWTYATAEKNKITRARDDVRAPAERQEKANSECKPFFSKYEEARKGTADEKYDRGAPLYDEVRSLLDNYRTTTHGPELTAAETDIKSWMERTGRKFAEGYPIERSRVGEAERKGDWVLAAKISDDFVKEFARDSELSRWNKEVREDFQKRMDKYVNDHIKKAKAMSRDDGRKLLEEAKPGLKGYEEKLQQIDKALSEPPLK